MDRMFNDPEELSERFDYLLDELCETWLNAEFPETVLVTDEREAT